MNVGDRVQTPDGPGTVITFWKDRQWSWKPSRWVHVVVELDAGQDWRKLYRPDELEPEAYSSKAENQAEALAMERWQEAKHGEPE